MNNKFTNGTFSFPTNAATSDNEELQVYLTGYIGETFWGDGIELTRLRNEVENRKSKKVKMYLSSEGGDVKAALDIVTYMKSQKDMTFEVINAGMAASAATIILAGGDRALSYSYAVGMTHKPQMISLGDSADMQEAIQTLDVFENSIINIYLSRIEKNNKLVNNNREDTAQYIKNELLKPKQMTWLSANDMLENGLIDKVIDQSQPSKTVQNHITNSLTNFQNIPENFKDKLNTIFNNQNTEEMNFTNIVNAAKKALGIDIPENATETQIVDAISNYKPIPTTEGVTTEQVDNQISAKTTEFETKMKTELEGVTNQFKDLKTQFETVSNVLNDVKTQNEDLKTKVANLQNAKTELETQLAQIKAGEPALGGAAPTQAVAIITDNTPASNAHNSGFRTTKVVTKERDVVSN